MNIDFKKIKDTGQLVEVSEGFRQFYIDYIEQEGERKMRKLFALAMESIATVDWGHFETPNGRYVVELKAKEINGFY